MENLNDTSKELMIANDKNSGIRDICKAILIQIGNLKTKIIISNEIRNDYYIFLNDTIYLSDSNFSDIYSKICVIAHESAHSIQSKFLQILNFVSWHLEIIFFFWVIIQKIIFNNAYVFYLIYLFLWILSAGVRILLEVDASKKSISIASKYLEGLLIRQIYNEVVNEYNRTINGKIMLYIFSLLSGKLIRMILIVLIIFFWNK